jgi:iron complex outermembrane receptor protein
MNPIVMTSIIGRFLMPALLLVAVGCGHTQPAADYQPNLIPVESPTRSGNAELTADEIARSGEQTVEEILQGRVSGVYVTRTPDGGFALRIRGSSTFNGSNEPLIVIDGKPLNKNYRGSIPVSPYDIETIRVLKSAGQTAFYGVRGANGVIEITTKRGGS